MPSPATCRRSLFRSILAGFAAMLVLGLGLLAYAPTAHAWLHDDDHDHASAPTADHHCAVTALAHGIDSTPVNPLFSVSLNQIEGTLAITARRPLTAAPGHLRPAGRAPPAGG